MIRDIASMTTVSATRSDYFRCIDPQLRQGHLLPKGFHTDADKESRVQKNHKKLSQLNCQLAMIFIAVIPVYSALCTKINVKIFEGFLANDHPDQIKGAAKDHLRLTKGIMSMKNI